jgi:SpoVK/Ycf46/Vps4 family AAA+-type ATPase
LAGLGLTGRRQDILTFLQRTAHKFDRLNPPVAAALKDILRESPSPAAPVRSTTMPFVPVDPDSRLKLVRVESAPISDPPLLGATALANVNEIVAERRREAELRAAGLEPTRTALFVGPPGVGKTMSARWIASELKLPLLILDLSAVISSYLGKTGINVKQVLEYAKGTRAVLLLDEIDAVAKRRDDAEELGELKRLVAVLIQEIDDWSSSSLLLAATNHPDLLDPAIWRRFERVVEFSLPTAQQTCDIIARYGPSNMTDCVAIALHGRSFSDIERELKRARRQSVLLGRPYDEMLGALVQERAQDLKHQDRIRLATRLAAAGLSDRQVNDITRVSRDTLRRRRSHREE